MPLKLFKRKTNDGGFVWHCRGDVAGSYIRRSLGTADKQIAARLASEIEHRQYKRRFDDPKEELTFPLAVELYQKAGKGKDWRSASYITKLEDHWKNTKVKDMNAGAILRSAKDLYPGCSGATWNRQVITPTQAVINHCAELNLCSPIRIRRFKFERKIKQPVTVEWLETFCAHARPLNVALVMTMFATACRINEAMRLEWKDVDFQQRTILIRDSKTKQERVAHMPTRLLVALANLPRDRKPFFWSESSMRRSWDEDVAKAAEAVQGFERLTFHSCRHGFATKMLRDGIDPKTAATLGGWKDVALFFNTYAHAMKEAKLTEEIFRTPEQKQGDRKTHENT